MCYSRHTECMNKFVCLYEAAFGSSVLQLLVVLKMPTVAGIGELLCRKLLGTGCAGIVLCL